MCGISGTIGLADRRVIEAMTEAIAHRGPDDHGVLIDEPGQIALGHRRLSIIDLSAAGHQPMTYRNDRYWIVLNGEIYNFIEIRSELEERGHTFRSTSDTEVLLAAYAEWGAACLERLRGMFAFAIYDRGSEAVGGSHIFLARDRFGIKPLYYAKVNDVFVFASEIKALLASGLISRRIDNRAVWDYLSLGSIPQPRTILSDVKALLPGHAMTIDSVGEIKTFPYWDIATNASKSFPDVGTMDKKEASTELRRLLDEATRLHMIADVPIGAFLSGGIDSTSVVGLMDQYVSRPIKTYSVGFESRHAQLNECEWARVAAERFRSDHTEVIVTGDEIAVGYDKLVWAIDQPSLDGTNTYLVSKAARTGVTVALSGIGGDELFAGYPHFQRFVQAAKWKGSDSFLSKRVKGSVLWALPNRYVPDKQFLTLDPLARHTSIRSLATEGDKQHIANKSFRYECSERQLSDMYAGLMRPALDPVSQTSYVEVKGYLANTLLRDADAMSMAHALEVRPVMLDHVLAEFIFALPPEFKVKGAATKVLLTDALSDILPEQITKRPKMGFEMPLFDWLAGPLYERALAALSSRRAASIFSSEFIIESKRNLKSATGRHVRLWGYVMLIEWLNYHQCEV